MLMHSVSLKDPNQALAEKYIPYLVLDSKDTISSIVEFEVATIYDADAEHSQQIPFYADIEIDALQNRIWIKYSFRWFTYQDLSPNSIIIELKYTTMYPRRVYLSENNGKGGRWWNWKSLYKNTTDTIIVYASFSTHSFYAKPGWVPRFFFLSWEKADGKGRIWHPDRVIMLTSQHIGIDRPTKDDRWWSRLFLC